MENFDDEVIFDDEELIALRNKILPDLQKMDIQSEEIENKIQDLERKNDDFFHKNCLLPSFFFILLPFLLRVNLHGRKICIF